MAAGRPSDQFGFVNTPVYRGSTVLFPSLDAIEGPHPALRIWAHRQSEVRQRSKKIITELEGAAGTRLAPSGLSAIATALMSVAELGRRHCW